MGGISLRTPKLRGCLRQRQPLFFLIKLETMSPVLFAQQASANQPMSALCNQAPLVLHANGLDHPRLLCCLDNALGDDPVNNFGLASPLTRVGTGKARDPLFQRCTPEQILRTADLSLP